MLKVVKYAPLSVACYSYKTRSMTIPEISSVLVAAPYPLYFVYDSGEYHYKRFPPYIPTKCASKRRGAYEKRKQSTKQTNQKAPYCTNQRNLLGIFNSPYVFALIL